LQNIFTQVIALYSRNQSYQLVPTDTSECHAKGHNSWKHFGFVVWYCQVLLCANTLTPFILQCQIVFVMISPFTVTTRTTAAGKGRALGNRGNLRFIRLRQNTLQLAAGMNGEATAP
jgi:hypothetical protein